MSDLPATPAANTATAAQDAGTGLARRSPNVPVAAKKQAQKRPGSKQPAAEAPKKKTPRESGSVWLPCELVRLAVRGGEGERDARIGDTVTLPS